MRRVHRDLRLEERIGELVEERRAVLRIDLDHREPIGGLIVDEDAGRDAERLGARAWQRARFEFREQFLPVGERVLDRARQPADLPLLGEGAAERVLDEEIVEREPVARRVDARVDDVAAGEVDAPRHAIEEPRMVGGEHHHQRRAAVLVGHRRDMKRRVARRLDMAKVGDDHLDRFGDPIAFGQAIDQLGEGLVVFAEQQRDRFLLRGDPRLAPALLVAEAQHFLGRVVEFGEKLALPAVPHAGPDGANVDDGEDEQQAQPLGALHDLREIEDRLEVGEVAFEGGRRHQQVIAHQPRHRLGLRRIEPQPRTDAQREFGAEHAMVAAAPLGDVVEQHRDIEHAPRVDLVEDRGRQRMIVGEPSLLDVGEQSDRADRMFVDGIMMIHVELHLRDDAAEIGHEAAEHPRLVHPAQHRFGIARAGQHVEEQFVRAGVPAHPLRLDQLRIVPRLPHRLRVNLQPMLVGERENLDEPHRISLKEIVRRQREPAAVEDEAVELARPPPQGRQEAPPARRHLLVEMREESAGDVADRLGMDEIELHEAFDRALPRPLGEVHPLRDLALEIEGQPVLGPPGEDMEMAAHREQEILGALELLELAARQQPRADQLGHGAHAVDELADPEQCVEVA